MKKEEGKIRVYESKGGAGPSLALVDVRNKRQTRDRQDFIRLAPMASLAMVLASFFALAFMVLYGLQLIPANLSYEGGLEAYTLRAFLVFGFIPLLSLSLTAAFFRPPVPFLTGSSKDLKVLLSAPALGFLLASFLWILLQLLDSFFPSLSPYLALPDLWQKGALYLGRSKAASAAVLSASLLLPATCHEALHRAFILPAYTGGKLNPARALLPSLLAAGLALELPGLVVFFVMAFTASRVRTVTASLIASSLSTAGFALAMIFARPLFAAISRRIFDMPLIDNLKVRLFLTTMALILAVLLIVPWSVMSEEGARRQGLPGPRKRQEEAPFRPYNRILALLCLTLLGLAFYFLS